MNDKSQIRPWGSAKANPKRRTDKAEMSTVLWLSTWGFSPDEVEEISEIFDLSSRGSFDFVAEAVLERLHFAMEFYPFRGPYGWVGTWEKYGRKLQADLGINGDIIDYFLVVVKNPNMAMTGLRKVSDLMMQRPLTSGERKNDYPTSNGVIARNIKSDADEYAKVQDEPSKPESSNSVNFGSTIASDLEGDLDNFTPHSSGAFKAEVSAEEYFNSHRGKQARGIFQKVDVIRWDHDEEDWTLEEFEFESPANSIDTSSARPPRENQQQQETSGSLDGSFQHLEAFVRLREFALRRRWLSAAAALDKASQQSAPLSKRERAAIEHVLNVAGTFTRHWSDSDLLRRALPNAENRKDEVEPVHQSARPKKATAAKVTNRKPPDSKSNMEHGMPTQKEISSSVLRVRQIAAERSWLSPKSSRALAKLSDKKAALGHSETNSLNYLLGRFENISELTVDVENLRKRIGSKVERRG